jgi:hypothetical protein
MPFQAKDKIRLLIQKLEERFLPPNAVSEKFVVAAPSLSPRMHS